MLLFTEYCSHLWDFQKFFPHNPTVNCADKFCLSNIIKGIFPTYKKTSDAREMEPNNN